MWRYNSDIGSLYIQRLPDGRFGFVYSGTVWESSHTPQAEADNVYLHATGCWEWDKLDGQIEAPSDLSEWDFIPDPQ